MNETEKEEEEEKSLKLATGQPWALSVSDFVFLVSSYESGWPLASPLPHRLNFPLTV